MQHCYLLAVFWTCDPSSFRLVTCNRYLLHCPMEHCPTPTTGCIQYVVPNCMPTAIGLFHNVILLAEVRQFKPCLSVILFITLHAS